MNSPRYTTDHWSMSIEPDWTSDLDEEVKVFSSPDGLATMRIYPDVIWRRETIEDSVLPEIISQSGVSMTPTPTRIGGLRGLEADHDDGRGQSTHSWWLISGRLLLIVEFQSRSRTYGIDAATRLLSSIVVNDMAIRSIPLEISLLGHIGRIAGTIVGGIRRYQYPIAFLILVAVLLLLGAGRF
jgi:hypothetical protein